MSQPVKKQFASLIGQLTRKADLYLAPEYAPQLLSKIEAEYGEITYEALENEDFPYKAGENSEISHVNVELLNPSVRTGLPPTYFLMIEIATGKPSVVTTSGAVSESKKLEVSELTQIGNFLNFTVLGIKDVETNVVTGLIPFLPVEVRKSNNLLIYVTDVFLTPFGTTLNVSFDMGTDRRNFVKVCQ